MRNIMFLFGILFFSLGNGGETIEAREKKNTPEKHSKQKKKKSCISHKFNLKEALNNFAKKVETQRIFYNSEPLTDCSGMFLRVVEHIKKECPGYIYPDPKAQRTTKLLAQWYHDKKNMVFTPDITKYANKIKPGVVVFFGHQGKNYKNINIKKLVGKDGVQHIGVVTDVKKENGKVVGYTLFHGRRSGTVAQRTTWHTHKGKTKNNTYYPPFGNGTQQVVALAFIITDSTKRKK